MGSFEFGEFADLIESDCGGARGLADGDDLGDWFVAEGLIGDQADPHGPVAQQFGVAFEAIAQGFEVGDGGFAEAEAFEIAEVVGRGPDEQVVFQVGVGVAGRVGGDNTRAGGGQDGRGCWQIEIQMGFGGGGFESEDEEGE